MSDAELLAVVLRAGVKGESALDLARRVIHVFGSLRNISSSPPHHWKKIKGLGQVKMAKIRAAFELGKRVVEDGIEPESFRVSCANDIAQLLSPRMRDLKIEVFKVIYLDGQNRVITIEDMARGTVNQVGPIIREIIHKGLIYYAAGMVCAHNHPSGSLEPSKEDQVFTGLLKAACGLMGIKFIDHIIISSQGYCIVKEN